MSDLIMANIKSGDNISFDYTNHKGEKYNRDVIVLNIYYGKIEPYYPEPIWLLNCYDLRKHAIRSFDFNKIDPYTII